MAKAQKAKAEVFIKEAEALLSKKGWFSSSKERNAEEAAETFEKAANAYKVGGLNQEAGDAYVKAGEIYRDKLSNFNNASKSFNNAGKIYLFRPIAHDWPSVYLVTNCKLFRKADIVSIHFCSFFDRDMLQKEQSR